jgi:DNA mismatch endonuclease, patch repair protein
MDVVTKRRRSEIMSSIRSKNTRPEAVVRRFVRQLGYTVKEHAAELPGTPDLVLPQRKAVIFVHGCFWHGCGRCDRGTRVPQTNTRFWQAKIATNRLRDRRVAARLRQQGWHVITVWACQTKDTLQLRNLLLLRLTVR